MVVRKLTSDKKYPTSRPSQAKTAQKTILCGLGDFAFPVTSVLTCTVNRPNRSPLLHLILTLTL